LTASEEVHRIDESDTLQPPRLVFTASAINQFPSYAPRNRRSLPAQPEVPFLDLNTIAEHDETSRVKVSKSVSIANGRLDELDDVLSQIETGARGRT
jgi:hypothetical protein